MSYRSNSGASEVGLAQFGLRIIRAMQSSAWTAARRLSAWQRHSEAGAAARAEAVVAPQGPARPDVRGPTGHRVCWSRFRASTVTFMRRHGPYRRSPRSRSSGCRSARAERSSHRRRDKRCSVSPGPAASWPSTAWPLRHASGGLVRLQVTADRAASKHIGGSCNRGKRLAAVRVDWSRQALRLIGASPARKAIVRVPEWPRVNAVRRQKALHATEQRTALRAPAAN